MVPRVRASPSIASGQKSFCRDPITRVYSTKCTTGAVPQRNKSPGAATRDRATAQTNENMKTQTILSAGQGPGTPLSQMYFSRNPTEIGFKACSSGRRHSCGTCVVPRAVSPGLPTPCTALTNGHAEPSHPSTLPKHVGHTALTGVRNNKNKIPIMVLASEALEI